MRASPFARFRLAAAISSLLAGIAMLIYPGGTALDRATSGYSFSRNFLSDLGSTVTYGGQSNSIGAALFAASLVVLILAMGGTLVTLMQLYSEPIARRFAWVAAVAGAVACVAFIGVAATPENRFLGLHIRFTTLAFRAFLVVTLLMAIATTRDPQFSRRAAAAWASLTALLIGHVAFLQWGPRIVDDRGLAMQATEQKVIACAVLIILLLLSVEADRAVSARERAGHTRLPV